MRIAVHTGDFGHVFNFTLVARGRRCDFMRLAAEAKGLLSGLTTAVVSGQH